MEVFGPGPGYGLPTADPSTLSIIAALLFAKQPFAFNPHHSARTYPLLRHGLHLESARIFAYLKRNAIDLDLDLSPLLRAQSLAYIALIDSPLNDALVSPSSLDFPAVFLVSRIIKLHQPYPPQSREISALGTALCPSKRTQT